MKLKEFKAILREEIHRVIKEVKSLDDEIYSLSIAIDEYIDKLDDWDFRDSSRAQRLWIKLAIQMKQLKKQKLTPAQKSTLGKADERFNGI